MSYVTELVITLHEVGGSDAQAYNKCYKGSITTPCLTFNSETTVFKQVHHLEGDVDKITVKVQEEYRVLVTDHTWVSSGKFKARMKDPCEFHKKYAKSHQSDISDPVARTEQNEILIKKLNNKLSFRDKTVFVSLQSNKKDPTKTKVNPYNWEIQYGSNMEYDDIQSFLQWLYTQPKYNKSIVVLNDLTWHWYKHYDRYRSHASFDCTKNEANKIRRAIT